MNRTSIRSLMLMALALVFAGAVRADVTAGPAVPKNSGEPAQGFIVAGPPDNNASAASRVAQEPQRLPPTEVQGYREDRAGPCDRRQGTGLDACRAQLEAKYAEMDKLCRSVSAAEFPTCIKSAYSAD